LLGFSALFNLGLTSAHYSEKLKSRFCEFLICNILHIYNFKTKNIRNGASIVDAEDREVWRALVEAAISARMAPETKK